MNFIDDCKSQEGGARDENSPNSLSIFSCLPAIGAHVMAKPFALIADASSDATQQLTVGLTWLGYSVVAVNTAQAAIEQLRSSSFDVLVTELDLPDGKGATLLAEIKSRQLPVSSVVTGKKISVERLAEAFRLGASDVVFKPVTHFGLQTALRRAQQHANSPAPQQATSAEQVSDFTPLPSPSPSQPSITVPLTGDFQGIQRKIVEEAILRFDGNKAAAARALGMHRRTLYRVLVGGTNSET